MRQRLDDSSLHNPRLVEGVKGNVVKQVLGGAITLAGPLQRFYVLDANGAGRNVTLPSESASAGVEFYIANSAAGAFSLTIKASDGTTTVGTVAQGALLLLVCDGVKWYTQ